MRNISYKQSIFILPHLPFYASLTNCDASIFVMEVGNLMCCFTYY